MARKVDSLGRVVLPAEMRRRFGIREGDLVEIGSDGHRIVLSKVETRCVFCDTDRELREFAGRRVCGSCLDALRRGGTGPTA